MAGFTQLPDPVPRPPLRLSSEVATAWWRLFSRHPGPPPIVCRDLEARRGIDVSTSFRRTRAPTCYRRHSRRPRSPFTPAAFPFRGCCTGAYSRPDVANTTSATENRRAGTATRTLVILEGTEAATSFLF